MKLSNNIFEGNFHASLTALAKKEFPAKISYDIAKFIREYAEKKNVYEQIRLKTIQKYGEEDKERPGMWQVKDVEAYAKEMEPIVKEEQEYEFNKIVLSSEELSKEGIKISPEILLDLEQIIEVQ